MGRHRTAGIASLAFMASLVGCSSQAQLPAESIEQAGTALADNQLVSWDGLQDPTCNPKPNPAWTPVTNGCGPLVEGLGSFLKYAVAQFFQNTNFFDSCCNTHDLVYGTCQGSNSLQKKDNGDNAMYQC